MQFDQLRRRDFITLVGGAAALAGSRRARSSVTTAKHRIGMLV